MDKLDLKLTKYVTILPSYLSFSHLLFWYTKIDWSTFADIINQGLVVFVNTFLSKFKIFEHTYLVFDCCISYGQPYRKKYAYTKFMKKLLFKLTIELLSESSI